MFRWTKIGHRLRVPQVPILGPGIARTRTPLFVIPNQWPGNKPLVRRIGAAMHWYDYLSYFFGGAFLSNALPHLINGISGNAFQSPFAKPPGKGLSSSTVNILWGFFNLVVAYVLVLCVGSFSLHNLYQTIAFGAGLLLMSLLSARTFGPLHGGA